MSGWFWEASIPRYLASQNLLAELKNIVLMLAPHSHKLSANVVAFQTYVPPLGADTGRLRSLVVSVYLLKRNDLNLNSDVQHDNNC